MRLFFSVNCKGSMGTLMSLAGWTHILSHACQIATVPFSWTLTQSHGKTSLWNWDSGHNLKQHLKLWCNFWGVMPRGHLCLRHLLLLTSTKIPRQFAWAHVTSGKTLFSILIVLLLCTPKCAATA